MKELLERMTQSFDVVGLSSLAKELASGWLEAAYWRGQLEVATKELEWWKKNYGEDDDDGGGDELVGPEPDGDGGLILAPDFQMVRVERK